jgi:hypothetical protein
MDAAEWLAALAAELGVAPPTDEEVAQLLKLASVAAHTAERIAAPISCWLAARAGVTPEEAVAAARRVAGE